MKTILYILISSLLLILGPEWPSKKFIKKYNYQEVRASTIIDVKVLDPGSSDA